MQTPECVRALRKSECIQFLQVQNYAGRMTLDTPLPHLAILKVSCELLINTELSRLNDLAVLSSDGALELTAPWAFRRLRVLELRAAEQRGVQIDVRDSPAVERVYLRKDGVVEYDESDFCAEREESGAVSLTRK